MADSVRANEVLKQPIAYEIRYHRGVSAVVFWPIWAVEIRGAPLCILVRVRKYRPFWEVFEKWEHPRVWRANRKCSQDRQRAGITSGGPRLLSSAYRNLLNVRTFTTMKRTACGIFTSQENSLQVDWWTRKPQWRHEAQSDWLNSRLDPCAYKAYIFGRGRRGDSFTTRGSRQGAGLTLPQYWQLRLES